ncbi:hypothetical protein GPL17_18790 [Bradyrhizobium yuanmingense]|uniref:hypothetical protein n=1 Tax=Bradyrhizobium yuanmingense TaxID=108015 RepID=UPI0012FC07C8|nr:hypothetical protein [Bradyrhizobium yuanmingense]MVT52531.1 hypothetical protein [Bradyrhizobium yuanmingense]
MRPAEESAFIVLIPYNPREGMSLKEAAARAGKSQTTVKNWCLSKGIGRRVGGGVWIVSRPALDMLLDGNEAALLLYHQGRFDSSEVRRYFERTKVPCPESAS